MLFHEMWKRYLVDCVGGSMWLVVVWTVLLMFGLEKIRGAPGGDVHGVHGVHGG